MLAPRTPATPLDVRRAGVLLHITSLPSERGTGDLGRAAYEFVDFLVRAGCTVWQVLPLVPVHEDEGSPYNALSAMAGSPDLISRARQRAAGQETLAGLTPDDRAAHEAWCAQQSAWL